MKALILAAGKGTRLGAATQGIGPNGTGMSKPLVLTYNKPTIYHPLADLIAAGIDDIQIIAAPDNVEQFSLTLGNGDALGINLSYGVQKVPRGIAESFLIARRFIGNDHVTLTFGDNIFNSTQFTQKMKACLNPEGATVFALKVNNPQEYGVVEFDSDGKAISIEEKPEAPKSNYAVPGMYFYDSSVVEVARGIRPSARGELEISAVNEVYLHEGHLRVETLSNRTQWFDTGTPDSLFEAASYVRQTERRTGRLIGSPEAAAFLAGFITTEQLEELAQPLVKSSYGKALLHLAVNGSW
ncbi:MAG TPA: sugar phosphate nucleotidyltransferase [Candidatus Saccharimonadales bacterium]